MTRILAVARGTVKGALSNSRQGDFGPFFTLSRDSQCNLQSTFKGQLAAMPFDFGRRNAPTL